MLLLDVRLAVPEQRRLRVVIGEPLGFAADLVVALLAGFRKRDEACRAGLERTAATQRIGLVRDPAAVDRLTMHAVTLVVVNLRDRRVDGNLVEVGTAQP